MGYRFLFALMPVVLLVVAPRARALDEGGDGAYIPNYDELQREGYGGDYRHAVTDAAKPTQAYHLKGVTIYYGYTPVHVHRDYEYGGDARENYAFGYPETYFREKMPTSVTSANLNNYAVAVNDPITRTPGDFFNTNPDRNTAITFVKPVKPKTPVENIAATKSEKKTGKTPAIALRATAPVTNPATIPAAGTATLPAIGEPPADKPASGKASN